MSEYDCVPDVRKHKLAVWHLMGKFVRDLEHRALSHDNSKLEEPEKAMFDIWTPRLKEVEFGSTEYQEALAGMGEALKHHYASNRHHPEHFESGVDSMTLVDLIEMLVDWIVAARSKGQQPDLNYLSKRFDLSEQLVEILANTLAEYSDDN